VSRARNIKPGFFKNDVLADCPLATRLLFIALWCEADREGRLEYRPKRIKAACLPYDDVNIEDAIAALTERGFLTIYEVAGVQYIQVNNWAKHQNPHHKEIGSEIPAPPGHIDTVCSGYIPLSNTIRNRIYARDGRVCKECGATHGLSIDHIVPVSRGGNSTDDNLQVLCLGCNVRKGNKFHASTMDESCTDQGSTKQVASCPTDSLIPDSLNLIPDSREKKKRRPAVNPPSVSLDSKRPELFAGVPAQIVADFKALRTKLRAPITQTAMAGIEREAVKAGVSVADALRLCCERGWRGFKAEWVTEPARGSPSKPPIAQSFAGKHYEGTPDDQLPPSLRPDPPQPAP
jgi:hypothetical protein